MQDIDLRPQFLGIRDQGKRGTCVAFAVTAGHEQARFRDIAVVEALSEEALYYQCKQIDGDTDPGTSFNSAGTALETMGQPSAGTWLYDKRRDETAVDYVPPPDAIDPQFCHKAELVAIPSNIQGITDNLELGNSVVIGIAIYQSFITAPGGRVPMPLAHETVVGHHALLLVGFETDSQQTRWALFRNSWGTGWGDQGYGYLLLDYLTTTGCEAFIIVTK